MSCEHRAAADRMSSLEESQQSNLLKNNMKIQEGSALRSRRAEMHPMAQAPDDFMPPYWELLQST
jgi:hypothetical protein